jgi:16S rRNA (uracil1498-N3)-methyltransferase
MADRYFLEIPPADGTALLSGSEAHHLAHVMRAHIGDEVLLFDGSGAEYTARVEQVGRSEIRLAVVSRREADVELAVELALGVALPKGERQRWLVEKAVELGVRCLTPLVARRGVAQPSGTAIVRLRRAVIEASKQCGRNRLMEIAEPQPLAEYLTRQAADTLRWFAHPGGMPWSAAFTTAGQRPAPRGARLAVGPEGGFDDQEVALAREHGWQIVDLGPRTLRVETAALALAAVAAAQLQK